MEENSLKELQDLKKLIMVLLIKIGASPEELGFALDVHPSRISQLLPVRKIKRIVPGNG